MLHEKKKQSILSWVQSAGGHDVTSFSQLSDGKLLNELVVTLSDKDCNVSSQVEIDSEETDSAKLSKTSDGGEHELIEEIDDFSLKKLEDSIQEQDVVNGYHNSSTNELEPSGTFNHSSIKAEDCVVSENCVEIETSEVVLSSEGPLDGQEAEDPVTNALDSIDKDGATTELLEVSENGPLKMDCSDLPEHSNNIKNNDTDFSVLEDSDHTEIQRRYIVVQKFIESMLELECTALVNISQCLEGHELELAKLTVLLLSAMVQYSLSTKKDHIMAACYSLSPDAQEEIMDCLELFLKERQSPIERKEFHTRLSRRAKLRISPRKHSSVLSTPQFDKPLRRGRKRKAYNNSMEDFLDKGFESPIQNLIQSPNIRQITPNSEARLLDAVRCKDKTIALLTYDLDVEKYNVEDLKKQNEDLSFQLSKLKMDHKKLKEELEEVRANLENNEQTFEKAQNDWKKEVKSYQSQIKDLKEAENFWKESYQAEDTSTQQKSECTCSEEIGTLKCAMQAKDDKLKECQKEVKLLTVQLEKLSKSKLEESQDSDNKAYIQEKCFNISDLSLRNELKDKCEELQNLLKETEIELSLKAQKVEELLLQKEKVEKECRVRLRKTDKEREDAIQKQKKLEMENSNLKGQIEALEKVLPEIRSPLLPSVDSNQPSANRRSTRNRNVCDSEKIGQLWHCYDGEKEDSDNDAIRTGFQQDKPCVESSTVIPPQSETKSANRKASEKSRNELRRSRSASNISREDLETCKICSQNNYHDIPPLIENICKIVREDNILDTNVLFELHKYERGFDMKELVMVLTLLNKILLEGSANRSRRNSNGGETSKIYESELHCEKTKVVNAASDTESFKDREKLNDSIKMHEQLLKNEKKKVACLQSKLKNLKNLHNIKTKEMQALKLQLAKVESLQERNVERCKQVMTDNELKHKQIQQLKQENPAPVVREVIKCVPPPICVNCIKLREEIASLKIDLNKLSHLNEKKESELNNQKGINHDLRKELCKLDKKNTELEEKLSDPRIVGAGVYSPELKSLRQKLKASLYKNVDDGSPQEMQSHDVSTVTNCSFATTSVRGLDVSTNQTTKTFRAFCKAEDEAEMLSQSSIFEVQNDSPNRRLLEINRRNTLCLPHLKSQYPLELNTTPSQHKYFQPPSSSSRPSARGGPQAKKRKIASNTASVHSSLASILSKSRPSTSSGSNIHPSSTPKVKTFISKLHKTNSSAARLHFRRRSKDSVVEK